MIVINPFCLAPPSIAAEPDLKLFFNTSMAQSLEFSEGGSKLASITSGGNEDAVAGDLGGTIEPPTWTNNIMTFDGVNEALVAQDAGGQGTGDFTVAMVIQSLSTTPNRTLVDKGGTVWKLECDGGSKLSFTVSDGTDTDTFNTTDTVFDDWNHLVMLIHDKTADNYQLLIDDVAATGSPWTAGYRGTLAANQRDLTIGADADLSSFWTGSMMALMVWDKALSGAEQTEVYDWASARWTLGNPGG